MCLYIHIDIPLWKYLEGQWLIILGYFAFVLGYFALRQPIFGELLGLAGGSQNWVAVKELKLSTILQKPYYGNLN